MSSALPKQGNPLVYIETGSKYYARYVGRPLAGARFVANRELDEYEIELFRADPETIAAR